MPAFKAPESVEKSLEDLGKYLENEPLPEEDGCE